MGEESGSQWVVVKFGGTSVSTLARWETIAGVVREHLEEGLRPIVVCSALSGVTNSLIDLLDAALRGEYEAILEEIFGKHRSLAQDMGLDADALLAADFERLTRLAKGASLISEVSPRLHAKVLAFGELMSTKLGAAYLNKIGLPTTWMNASEWLLSDVPPGAPANVRYLQASCDYGFDKSLQERFAEVATPTILTQGFIARDAEGDIVLLGRGGSDTSASYIAAKIHAARCEIWTDVPGMYTANPKQIPAARLLKRLDYGEAQEIASTGAKVLHPRCIDPCRRHRIPLHVRCTEHPHIEGTGIYENGVGTEALVKAISTKHGVALISMDTLSMWQQAGFLADVFTCFKNHGLSIDLVSTSETNVTVSLDAAGGLDQETQRALLYDLKKFCDARLLSGCASVSLVGRNVRTILPKLGPALEVFEEKKIYLVSQAASDLNLTFVVDDVEAERLARELHALFFREQKGDALLGPTWREVFEKDDEEADSGPAAHAWWIDRRDELIELAGKETPLYVYDQAALLDAAARLKALKAVSRIFFAMKANFNAEILKTFHDQGLGFETVSIGEIQHLKKLFPDLAGERILFTPNFAPREEYEAAFKLGAYVTLDNLHPLAAWPDLFAGKSVLVRIDPGKGMGHHHYVHTAGAHSKFGISPEQFETLLDLVARNGVNVIGLHAHTGSGILKASVWRETALTLIAIAERFPAARILDVGGGLGVPEKPGQWPLELDEVDNTLQEVREANPQFELWLEPGRFLVAKAGVILAKVTQTKQKGDYHYVGVDAGMHTLIRPALYGAYHEIVNLSRLDEPPAVTANIVGPICETGDTLGYSRRLPEAKEGDVMLISTAGAYGRAMSSSYNLRGPAREILLPAARKR
ncbi:MAG: bifunctional aspartate kinase/diaminopimelate decarboxylase [Myxococcales bacterium]|nr:MAG: bifunctional aspartate kinase/diaminopimelate decarboxylase [Myxococcales bacterium]